MPRIILRTVFSLLLRYNEVHGKCLWQNSQSLAKEHRRRAGSRSISFSFSISIWRRLRNHNRTIGWKQRCVNRTINTLRCSGQWLHFDCCLLWHPYFKELRSLSLQQCRRCSRRLRSNPVCRKYCRITFRSKRKLSISGMQNTGGNLRILSYGRSNGRRYTRTFHGSFPHCRDDRVLQPFSSGADCVCRFIWSGTPCFRP